MIKHLGTFAKFFVNNIFKFITLGPVPCRPVFSLYFGISWQRQLNRLPATTIYIRRLFFPENFCQKNNVSHRHTMEMSWSACARTCRKRALSYEYLTEAVLFTFRWSLHKNVRELSCDVCFRCHSLEAKCQKQFYFSGH
jgi:hypothetical protein